MRTVAARLSAAGLDTDVYQTPPGTRRGATLAQVAAIISRVLAVMTRS